MSSVQTHPEDGLLLRYLDGELPGRKSRQVRRHLEACWQCRSGAEEFERTIADCVRYRTAVLQPPPAPWSDLSEGFARIDSEVRGESLPARLGRWFAAPPALRWSFSAAVALVLAAGLYYQFRETPSVQAAALLKRAVSISAAHPGPARPVRIRTNVRNRAVVPAMLRAAHYRAEAPLSARSFQEWRDGLASKRDDVATVPDPEAPSGNCYRIRTTAAEGELASASLMLRATDLRPVESRFEFRNQDWVEYSEISDASTPDGGIPAEARLDAPMRRVVPSRPAVPSGDSASISEELRVLSALHEIGADLGDPVEVHREAGRVLVGGVGVPAERRRKIQSVLSGIPNVAIQFSDPSGAAIPDDAGVDSPGAGPKGLEASGIQARLEKHLGGRAEFERFSGQLLEALDSAMSRAYALRALAQRFPEGTEMSAHDRAVLAELAREHANALFAQINELHRTLAPVLASLGGGAAQGRPAAPHRTWQAAAEDALRSSRRVEVLLSTVLGVTPESANAQVPSELLAAFADLRSAIEACQRLL